MVTNNFADRGGVILNAGASARDISTNVASTPDALDLVRLVDELSVLRSEMKAASDVDSDTQDVAVGQVTMAQQAARLGDMAGALAALKAAGKWTLEIAEKIGVGVVVAVIKDQLLK